MNRHVPPHDFEPQQGADARRQALRSAAVLAPRAAPDFRSARRHSARVRWIRRLLPVSILASIAVIATLSVLSRLSLSIDLPFDIGHLTLNGSRLTMELPKLSGFTDDNRGFRVTARTATQDLTQPDLIGLADVEARLELADKGWASVNARTGTFDTKKQFITLGDGVDLAMDGGYAGRLHDAAVDVKAGSIVTDKPVVLTYLDGKIVADRLSVTDRGKRALFQGNVQLDFLPSQLPGRQQGTDPAPTGSTGAAQPAPVADAARAHAPAASPAAAPAPAAALPLPPPAPLPPRRPAAP